MKIKCTFHIAIAFILIQLTDEFSIAFAYGICEKNPYVRILYVTFAILSLLTMIYLYTKYIIRIQMQDLFLGMPLPKKKWCITAVLMPVLICLFYIFFTKGTLEKALPTEMEIKQEGEEIVVTRPNDLKKMKSLHGLTRTLINNMVIGVTEGYQKVLEVNGVGYRAAKSGNKLTLNLGYSHPVEMEDPEGVETVVEGQNKIIVKGLSKEKVGQYAAEIRDKRRPEPYKGKGIKYADEVIRRKVGKTGKK